MNVAESELPDGGMITGKVGEDDVLLARRGDELFAVSAHCTHYHGPLAEGLMVGETVRCPWHHACFDLRTGAAIAAPALRPLQTYSVRRENGRILVEPDVSSRAQSRDLVQARGGSLDFARDDTHIVILGAGAAGSFAANELRRLGYGGRVTLITREDRLPYDKPNLSKDYLAGKAPQEWIPLFEEGEYAARNIDLRLGTTVESIDAARGELRLGGDDVIPFDRLILATGASPRRLDIPVTANARVHYLRTWTDADALVAETQSAKRAVVIGASFIGLETAASLRERGIEVTVVGMEERPLERVVGTEVGDFIRRLHEEHGVRFRLGRKPVEIRADAVLLDDGSSEPCDFVAAGVGVIPDTTLAERAGLKIDRGIVVDEFLETSAPNVFAAGDIARYPTPHGAIRVEHWVAAGRQGQAAARNAMGLREPFKSVPFFWSQHYDLVFAYVGHAERTDDVALFGSLQDHNFAAVYRDQGRVSAVVTLFRDDISLAVEAAMDRGDSDEAIVSIVRDGFEKAP